MTRTRLAVLAVLVVLTGINVGLFALRGADRSTRPEPDRRIVGDFALLDQHGAFHQLSRYGRASAIVLYVYGIGCHVARQGVGVLQEVRRQFADRHVVVLMIDANPQDDRSALRAEAALLGTDIPILRDDSQLVVESLRVTRTGEAILLDPKTWRLVYRGPLDDRLQDGAARPVARRRYLVEALDAHLAGRPVAVDTPAALGCAITPLAAGGADQREVAYASDVAPILEARCRHCHTRGGIGPWAMDGYPQIKGWSAMIREVILTGRMPPWPADPTIGRFSPDRSLGVAEKRTLVHWIEAGAPRGAGPDPLAERPPAPASVWPLGRPAAVVDVPVQEIPASGTIDYRYVRIPTPFARDTWIRAAHFRPGNRAVMHHGFIFVEYPAGLRTREPAWADGMGSYFAIYAPGYDVAPFPEGSGQLLPAGSTLVFQLHYTPVGYATTDQPSLALYVHDRPPSLEYRVESAVNHDFRIPPHAPDHEVEATHRVARGVTLRGLFPHMHYRGSRFEYEARYPDGRREVLLSVPRYQFAWQTLYTLATPKPLPAGTVIRARGAYDNSDRNPANPDPSKEVGWGGQSWDEMFVGYLVFTAPVGPR